MRTEFRLPPSLPEDERRADYDFEIIGSNVRILQRLQDLPETNLERHEWTFGICRATFGSIRRVPLVPLSTLLSHWGVYFTRVQDNSEQVSREVLYEPRVTGSDAKAKVFRSGGSTSTTIEQA